MGPQPSSKDFLQLYGDYSKELYSERFYDAMDKESTDLQNYHHKCKDIIVNTKEKGNMIPICKKYLRFLDKSQSWRDVNSGYNISLLLNYWLYEKLYGIYGPNNNELIIYGFSALQQIWDTFDSSRIDESYYKKCKPNLNMVNHTDWEKRKKLYDYYVDYGTLYSMARYYDEACKYYKLIQDKKALYDHFAQPCASGGGDCPDFYDQCKPYNPKDVLPDLYCHAKMQAAARAPEQSLGTRDAASQNLQHVAGGGPREFQAVAASTEDTPSTSQSSDIQTKVANSFLGAAPVLFTATMLYRVYTHL